MHPKRKEVEEEEQDTIHPPNDEDDIKTQYHFGGWVKDKLNSAKKRIMTSKDKSQENSSINESAFGMLGGRRKNNKKRVSFSNQIDINANDS